MKRAWLILVGMIGCAAPVAERPRTWISAVDASHPWVGRIIDVDAGAPVPEATLRERVLAADFILIGETHDNPDHHLLQAEIIGWLGAAGKRPAVVFEMLDKEQQAVIDAALATSRDADALARAVSWESSGWPPWPLYQPVFAAALREGAQIIAAGLTRQAAMKMASGEAPLDPELVATYGLSTPLPADAEQALREELHASHCGHFPPEMLGPMIDIQRARDALMAEAMVSAGSRPVVLIAGNGHARTDRGVPMYLRQRGVSSVISVGLVEVLPEATTLDGYARTLHAAAVPFQLAWLTPRAKDEDPCAAFSKKPAEPAPAP